MSGLSEIDAMKAVDSALKQLQSDECQRVLSWACAKFSDPTSPQVTLLADTKNGSRKGIRRKSKGAKKSKSIAKMIKDLDLHPMGKMSAEEFAKSKNPTNTKQKGVVAIYYLRETAEVPQISVDHVYTYFKSVGWPVPADTMNTLAQAGSAGWLDTADGQNIKITSTGENLIEHQLPAAKAKPS